MKFALASKQLLFLFAHNDVFYNITENESGLLFQFKILLHHWHPSRKKKYFYGIFVVDFVPSSRKICVLRCRLLICIEKTLNGYRSKFPNSNVYFKGQTVNWHSLIFFIEFNNKLVDNRVSFSRNCIFKRSEKISIC